MTDNVFDPTGVIQSAPDAPSELRPAASVLHGRIVLLVTKTWTELARAHAAEHCRNVVVSAQISALAECILGLRVDRDYVVALLDQQIAKIHGTVPPFGK